MSGKKFWRTSCGILLPNLILLLGVGLPCVESGPSVGPPFPMTASEAASLQQFKKIILPQIPPNSLVANFSRDDLYLMRWLQSQSLNVRNAEQKFLQNVRWREEEQMDLIDQENWVGFHLDYPGYFDTFDKVGRPTSELWISDWDVRKAVLAGHGRLLTRWMNRMFELNTRRLYRLRSEGKNVTQAVLLADVEGFNFRHGCAVCNQIYIRLGYVWEHHYPGLLQYLAVVNMTPSFQMVLDGMKPFLTQNSKRALISYVLRRQWLPFLDMLFEKSERSVRFGGTKERPY